MLPAPGSVRFRELEALLDHHVSELFPENYDHSGSPHHAFTVGGQTFNIPEPKGSPFVKPISVRKNFLNAMRALGLYEEE